METKQADQFKKWVLKEETPGQKVVEAPNPPINTTSTEQWTPKVGEWAVCKNNPGVAEEIVKVDQYLRLKGREQQCCHKENYRKALPHEIPGNTPSPTNESLLEEAKRKYPVGCKVKSVAGLYPEEWIVRNGCWFHEGTIIDNSETAGNYLYKDGEWAEIIEEPKTVGLGGFREFSVGDWVTMDRWTSKPTVEQIVRIENGTAYIGRDRSVHLAFEKELRKATPEEIAKATGGSIPVGNGTASVGVANYPKGNGSITLIPSQYLAGVDPWVDIKRAEPLDLRFDDGKINFKKSSSTTQPSPKILVKSHEEFKITISKPKQIKL